MIGSKMDQKLLTFAGSDEPRDYFGLVICVTCFEKLVRKLLYLNLCVFDFKFKPRARILNFRVRVIDKDEWRRHEH